MKVCVYTVVTNGYDRVRKVPIKFRELDWCKFVYVTNDNEVCAPEGWDLHVIAKEERVSNYLYNRSLKFSVIEEFNVDYSVYIDGSIELGRNFEFLQKFLENLDIVYSVSKHPGSRTLIEEYESIASLGKVRGNEQKWIKELGENLNLNSYGLTENGVIIKSHHEKYRHVLETFKKEVIEVLDKWNIRDQLVTPVIASKIGLRITDLPFGVRSGKGVFKLNLHQHEEDKLNFYQKLKFWIKTRVI